jgi:hypothetical protein
MTKRGCQFNGEKSIYSMNAAGKVGDISTGKQTDSKLLPYTKNSSKSIKELVEKLCIRGTRKRLFI